MNFKIGDKIYIPKIKQLGKILEIQSKSNKLTILVGNIKLRLNSSEITLPNAEQLTVKKRTVSCVKPPLIEKKHRHAPKEIDLHGYYVADAINKLEESLNECILAGAHDLVIIHGLGTGKVKEAVLKYLSESPVISNYQTSPTNPGQTRAYF